MRISEISKEATDREDAIDHIGRSMSRMRVMTGRRLIARLAIHHAAPDLELSHLDALDAVTRAGGKGEVTVGTIAEKMRIDPSRASRIVADMVGRGMLRREASQVDARRILVVATEQGQRLIGELRRQKLALVDEITADWPAEDVDAFARLFERFIGGFEEAFAARSREIGASDS